MYWLVFRRYAPFDSFGGGFEGDSRKKASSDLRDTARTIGAVQFEPGHIASIYGFSSGTEFVGAGKIISDLLGKHYSKVNASVSVSTKSLNILRFTAQTSGANPMVPLAPEIDTFVDVQVVFGDRRMQLQGSVRGDDFPNAEVFVIDRFGSSFPLLDFKTTGGKETGPMTRLWGAHEKQVIGDFFTKLILDENGCIVGCSK